jgi:hypothetical protein
LPVLGNFARRASRRIHRADVYFYPMAPARREPVSIGFFAESPDVENKIDRAVIDHMTSIGLTISDF